MALVARIVKPDVGDFLNHVPLEERRALYLRSARAADALFRNWGTAPVLEHRRDDPVAMLVFTETSRDFMAEMILRSFGFEHGLRPRRPGQVQP